MTEHEKPHLNRYFVDAREYTTDHTALTGLQIKAAAAVSETYQLFLETEGDEADRAISDGESVNLQHDPKHFFAVPPATFGYECSMSN
jgi:hypothetical protein